jgi:hypothetical protein
MSYETCEVSDARALLLDNPLFNLSVHKNGNLLFAPHIGHMKSDGKLGKNHLAGVLEDKL